MKYFLTISICTFYLSSFAQRKWDVFVINEDKEILKEIEFKDSSKIFPYLKDLQYKYIDKGNALAQVDSLQWDKTTNSLTAFFYEGPRFSELLINISEGDKHIIRKIPKISERILSKVPFQTGEITMVYESILKYLENNGFPFARVRLTQLHLDPELPQAKLEIDAGSLVTWKNIYIKGEAKISPNFVKTYIGIHEDDIYSEKLFDNINKRMKQLSFLSLDQSAQIIFTPEGADLYLYLKTNQTSSADGILGLQPNTAGKTVFTGNVNLLLNNLLKHGETMSLNWQSTRPKTQQLEIKFQAPFLFKTNFGIEGNFHLYKRDSSFLEIQAEVGVQYALGGANYLKAFYNFQSSNILSGALSDTLFNTGQTVRTNFYGLGLVHNQVDYLPNPTRGLNLDIQVSVGLRTASPKDSSGNVRKVKSTTSQIQSVISYFIPLGRRNTIRLGNATGGYYADTVYSNEVLRFGGLNSQRGFNQQSIYATFYSTFTLEYRFLLDKNSNIFAFYDQTFYENNSGQYYKDHPYGFGLGLSFGTKVGTFSISYALGSQFKNPIELQNGKIHFGYTAFF